MDGVLREAFEETGLTQLRVQSYLGSAEFRSTYDLPPNFSLRHFFHLLYDEEPPITWQHYEMHPSDGSPQPILFEFHWLSLAKAARQLHPYYRAKLAELEVSMQDSLG